MGSLLTGSCGFGLAAATVELIPLLTTGKQYMQDTKQDRVEIGRRMRDARLRAHLTVEEAAQAANVQPVAVQKWERGAAMPSLLELRPLLSLYGVMACQLLFGENLWEISPSQMAELSRADLSPGLRGKIDVLFAMLARAREPVWRED